MITGAFVASYSVGTNLVAGTNRGGTFVIIFTLGGSNQPKSCVTATGVASGSVGTYLATGVCNTFINVCAIAR